LTPIREQWISPNGDARILHGSVLRRLPDIPAESIHCCVTSPPYWGLRDYGTGTWEGGDEECDHKAESRQGKTGDRATRTTGHDDYYRDICRKCGARRIDEQIGLEETPEAFVAKLVDVFREVRRVLRDDGTLWLNLGDSYASSGGLGHYEAGATAQSGNTLTGQCRRVRFNSEGIKPKDLVGIPWMVAFALRADGWYLRQDIIWAKPNPMPESVRDRCTKAHEYIFLLSKSPRYWYDAEAIKEEGSGVGGGACIGPQTKAGFSKIDDGHASIGGASMVQSRRYDRPDYKTRNRRSVWTVATCPYPEAHFATFPPDLIEPCILAGCPEGGTVFDPFTGSGTTGEVCIQHGRRFVGCELNAEYIELAAARISKATRRWDVPLIKQAEKRQKELLT
jgi:DNA modification methylase